jgi:hypothetical protein
MLSARYTMLMWGCHFLPEPWEIQAGGPQEEDGSILSALETFQHKCSGFSPSLSPSTSPLLSVLLTLSPYSLITVRQGGRRGMHRFTEDLL